MKLTLNLGSGDRAYNKYPGQNKCFNVDVRKGLPKLSVRADLSKPLPFKSESVDYILASDVIEHFPPGDRHASNTKKLIKEWSRVLKKGGTIEFRMPNLAYICQQYVNRKKDPSHTATISWLLYGGQDYAQNFHYVGFDRGWFSKICADCGLKEIDYKEIGSNFEMKVRKL